MIEILYQDEYFVIVNKPSGMLVHPSREARQIKISLLKEVRDQINKFLYPIHRLDRPTSGIVLFGLAPEPIKQLQEIWHTNKVRKKYITLVRGNFSDEGEHTFALKDQNKVPKEAHTKYSPLIGYSQSTLLDIEIFTGRRHQIRRHFSRTVQHVLGDRKYGKKKYNDHYLLKYGLERLFLHAYYLEFEHPITKKSISITCPLPDDLQNVLNNLNKEANQIYKELPYL